MGDSGEIKIFCLLTRAKVNRIHRTREKAWTGMKNSTIQNMLCSISNSYEVVISRRLSHTLCCGIIYSHSFLVY